jgi:transposase
MEFFVGLDVSVKTTSVCVMDAGGAIIREGKTESSPEAISAFLSAGDRRYVRVGFGLAPRTHQSGEIDRRGKITKNGDETLRSALFEAALVLLRPQTKPSTLKAWGLRVAKRRGTAKAIIAVARRLSVVLHCMWVARTPFLWTAEPAMA